MSILVVDRAGRRPLLLLSGLVTAVSTGCLGLLFYLGLSDSLDPSLDWLPLAAIILAFVGYSVGYAAVPFLVMGELLPAR